MICKYQNHSLLKLSDSVKKLFLTPLLPTVSYYNTCFIVNVQLKIVSELLGFTQHQLLHDIQPLYQTQINVLTYMKAVGTKNT